MIPNMGTTNTADTKIKKTMPDAALPGGVWQRDEIRKEPDGIAQML